MDNQWNFMFTGWNDVFWYLTIITLALAIAQLGLPYATFGVFKIFLKDKRKEKEIMYKRRLEKVFGRLSIPAFAAFALLVAFFIFRTMYSFAFYFVHFVLQIDVEKIPYGWIYLGTGLATSVMVFLSARWFRKQWKSLEGDSDPPTETESLTRAVQNLTSAVNQLVERDKSKEKQLERLITHLENKEKNKPVNRRK